MDSIQTVTGRRFEFLAPSVDMIHPFDIAWALSGINRFTGHTKPYYSVAQHCVRVSYSVPEEFALQGLLHDAAEAYIGDISTPLKRVLNSLTDGRFKFVEQNIEEVVALSCGVPPPMPTEVKRWDLIDFAIARRDLMKEAEDDWRVDYGIKIPPMKKLKTMCARESFAAFVKRWIQLDPSKEGPLNEAARLLRSK